MMAEHMRDAKMAVAHAGQHEKAEEALAAVMTVHQFMSGEDAEHARRHADRQRERREGPAIGSTCDEDRP